MGQLEVLEVLEPPDEVDLRTDRQKVRKWDHKSQNQQCSAMGKKKERSTWRTWRTCSCIGEHKDQY